jgi:hypothetical protein
MEGAEPPLRVAMRQVACPGGAVGCHDGRSRWQSHPAGPRWRHDETERNKALAERASQAAMKIREPVSTADGVIVTRHDGPQPA